MKKLFISCPMRGRTKENIEKSMDQLHKIAEILAGEELEVVNPYISDTDYGNEPLHVLGDSIKKMADADYYISPTDTYDWTTCYIEREVAMKYGLRILDLTTYSMMPDALDLIRNEAPACPIR